MTAFPWSAGDQLNAADLNAIVNLKLLKKNSGGPNTSSNVDLDTVAITGLNANDIIVVFYTLTAVGGTSVGPITLANNTNSVSLGDIATTTVGVAASNSLSGFAFITPQGNDATHLLLNTKFNTAANAGGADTAARVNFVVSTGHAAGFTGTWTLALHKGADSGTCSLYWSWYAFKVFS